MTGDSGGSYDSQGRRRGSRVRQRRVNEEETRVIKQPTTLELRALRSEIYSGGITREPNSQNSRRQSGTTSSIRTTPVRHRHGDRPESNDASATRTAHRERYADDGEYVYKHPASRQGKGRPSSTLSKQPKVRVVYLKSEHKDRSDHKRRSILPGLSLGRSTTTPSCRERQDLSASRADRITNSRPALATESRQTQRSSFMGLWPTFAPVQKRLPLPRLVECMTCLSDDIPYTNSAKLKCGHRMCHSCLKRIFRLSIKDPQHMPPKCCTSRHIPLKHVDKLFDMDFKKRWNTKFQEYSTRNRIYCPTRRCGEWIKPASIHVEHGQKWGRCGRCKTKVCTLCSGKWHANKDCPKDEATNALLDQAARSGWQRCYSCREMVELKEGCNHMTCYEAVEADRQQHLHQMDAPRHARARAFAFLEEEENDDLNLAARLDDLILDDDDGRSADRTYRRPLPQPVPTYANATDYLAGVNLQRFPGPSVRMPALQVRRHDLETDSPPVARVIPRHARPRRKATVAERTAPAIQVRRVIVEESEPTSVLAGLGRRGADRVSGWRKHVMPGIEPEEGMLSVV